MIGQLMTQAEFARHRGVAKGSVTNWKKAGLIVLAEGPTGRAMVDVQRSELKLNRNIDPMRGRPSTGGQPPAAATGDGASLALEPAAPSLTALADRTLADERVQHLREQRIGQAMKNAQLAGELVPLLDAQRRVSEVGRAARDRIQSWFRSVAERIAAEKDVRQVMALGEAGIDEVFAELAAAAARGEFAGDDEEDLTPDERAELEAVEAAAAE